jgi:hypothetical protein
VLGIGLVDDRGDEVSLPLPPERAHPRPRPFENLLIQLTVRPALQQADVGTLTVERIHGDRAAAIQVEEPVAMHLPQPVRGDARAWAA